MSDKGTNSGWGDFFKSCGCVNRDKDNLSQSSNMSKKNLLANKEREEDRFSSFSNQEWVDLEDFQVDFSYDKNANGFYQDEYITTDPINFDYLKDFNALEKDEERLSQSSGLSKDSKGIKKNKKNATSTKASSKKQTKQTTDVKGKRNPWKPHEDARLIELVNEHGQSWALIATRLENRTGKQVRDRYLNVLRPNTKKGGWTQEEDQLILNLYYQHGHKWSKISSFVPNRTEGQVKNRFYAHIKKKILNNEGSTPPGHQNGAGANHKDAIPPSPGSTNDPADIMISYSNEVNKVPRNGSNEVFLDPESPSQKSTTFSMRTGMSGLSSINNEKDIDEVLDKIALFFENNTTTLPNQEGQTKPPQQDSSLTQKPETFEQLQRRKAALQYLLSHTDALLSGTTQ